jgi:hypothetical protein
MRGMSEWALTSLAQDRKKENLHNEIEKAKARSTMPGGAWREKKSTLLSTKKSTLLSTKKSTRLSTKKSTRNMKERLKSESVK